MTYSSPVSIQKEWETQLEHGRCRLTKLRKEIIRLIAESGHSLTPVEIYDHTLENGPRMGLMTVYRTMEIMESLHLIDPIHNPE
jgi:Fe2+ or Zn2+ uptake regulation protein